MKVDMQHFKPLALFQQFAKGSVKTEQSSSINTGHHINKQNVAASIVNNKLTDALGMPAQRASNGNEIFDFEAVGKNILSFVSDAMTRAKEKGASEGELNQMLSDAKKGIQEGLGDASKELQASGLLTKEFKDGIKATSEFLDDGLKELRDGLTSSDASLHQGVTNYREASHYNLTKDASFRFTTKEGDQVNITFNSDYLQQSASALQLSEGSSEYASLKETTFQAAFSFEVNGELNEDEQQAINDLMGSLQNVSDLFFDGNLDKAFEEAKTINMDPTHLAAFSMDLQRTETIASIKEYQQVMPGKEIAQQLMPINDELEKAYEHAEPFAIEAHLSELLGWLMPEEESSNELLNYSQAIFDQLKNLRNSPEE